MDKSVEKPTTLHLEQKQQFTQQTGQKRRLQSLMLVGALTIELLSPHVTTFYEELVSGECLFVGTVNNDLLRICNLSNATHWDNEVADLIGSQGIAQQKVIPENFGFKTYFTWVSGWERTEIAGISIQLPYIRRVLAVTNQ